MQLFMLEHSKANYYADFAVYGVAVAMLAVCLPVFAPRALQLQMAVLAVAGLLGWTLIEYVLHRFVLHGLQPFRRWHAEHHHRPGALMGTPTILSATLIVILVLVPALILTDVWYASALTFGFLGGYLAYALTHHATHHWHVNSEWLKRRKRWHALHHHRSQRPGRYGVTSAFWDHVFHTGDQGMGWTNADTRRDDINNIDAP